MCLDLRWWAFRRKARKDIVCYKYLDEDRWSIAGETTFRTPAQNFLVRIGETYTSYFDRRYDKYRHCWTIERGIHSLASLKDVIRIRDRRGSRTIVAKCVIPKGSYYYVGRWGSGFFKEKSKSYASTALKYVEIIPKS